jgi:outer membrane protein TolC
MPSSRSAACAGALAAALLAAPRAEALQPLEDFLRGARTLSPDNQEARAGTEVAREASSAATGRLLPGVALRGLYARNQYDVSEPVAGGVLTLTPHDQLDAYAILTVPLLDAASFVRARAASGSARAAQESEKDAALQVESAVAQAWYQVVADVGLVDASRRALDVARANLTLTEHQRAAGSVAGLDLDRARAEVERQVQQLASAELGLALDARALASRSGVPPELAGAPRLQDDLHPESALETFVPADAALPAIAAAREARRAQEEQARAQRLTLVPVLAGSLTEHGTNAPGLLGHDWAYQGVLALSWSLDFTTLPAIRAEDARLAAATAREERTRLAVHDAIHRAWNTVQTGLARSRSARAQAVVSTRAADLARERYRVGAGTQLDLLTAQRDAFAAEVNAIQADADLVNARAQLRLASGRSLLSGP